MTDPSSEHHEEPTPAEGRPEAEEPFIPLAAQRLGAVGLSLVVGGMLWVMLRPEAAMFGAGEALAAIGGLMVLTAIWKAADMF